jgi:hypothetical protein
MDMRALSEIIATPILLKNEVYAAAKSALSSLVA